MTKEQILAKLRNRLRETATQEGSYFTGVHVTFAEVIVLIETGLDDGSGSGACAKAAAKELRTLAERLDSGAVSYRAAGSSYCEGLRYSAARARRRAAELEG